MYPPNGKAPRPEAFHSAQILIVPTPQDLTPERSSTGFPRQSVGTITIFDISIDTMVSTMYRYDIRFDSLNVIIEILMKSSSDIRTNLAPIISGKAQTEDVQIEMNGESIAILTTKKPLGKIPPLLLKTMDAKNDWANVLALVVYKNASFMFKIKNCQIVYLVKDKNQENILLDRWRKHVKKYRNEAINTGVMDSIETTRDSILDSFENLNQEVEQIGNSIRCLFAVINRGGNLSATPEIGILPRKTEDDLESYEVDD